MAKSISAKIDDLISGQAKIDKDLGVLQEEVSGLKDIVGEYRSQVRTIEARQWKLSSVTAGLSALIAYFLKK